MQCKLPASGMPKITAVILAYKETESLSASLDTYEKAGLLQVRSVLCCRLPSPHWNRPTPTPRIRLACM